MNLIPPEGVVWEWTDVRIMVYAQTGLRYSAYQSQLDNVVQYNVCIECVLRGKIQGPVRIYPFPCEDDESLLPVFQGKGQFYLFLLYSSLNSVIRH